MPYELKKFKNGYKVCKKYDDKTCYSKIPLKYKTAYKQRQAIGISESLSGKGMEIQARDKSLIDIYKMDRLKPETRFLLKFLEKWLIDVAENNIKYKGATVGFDLRRKGIKDVSSSDERKAESIINEFREYEETLDEDDDVIKVIVWRAFNKLIDFFNKDGISQYLCVDVDSGNYANLFSKEEINIDGIYVMNYVLDKKNIYFRGISEISHNNYEPTEVYISTLCSSGGGAGALMLDYIKESMGKKKFLIDFTGKNYIKLESIGAYNTINFYGSQGFLINKDEYKRLKSEILLKLNSTDEDTIARIYVELTEKNIKEYSDILQYLYTDIEANSGYRFWFKNSKDSRGFESANIHKLLSDEIGKFIVERDEGEDEEDNEEEIIGGVKAPFGRIGGKSKLKKIIVEKYFPKDYENMTYVEPFIGAGSVYFYKEPSKKEVINDLDSSVYELFKGFKKYNGKDIDKDINGEYSKEKFNKIKNSNPTTEYKKFIKNLILTRTSFFGQKKSVRNKDTRISANFSDNKIKDRLKDTEIYNKNYKDIIEKFDSPNTFFYLDPPYENSAGLYTHSSLPIKDLYDLLKNIKGKFLISYNDSKDAKKYFRGYNINYENTVYEHTKQIGKRIKKEMLISNYNIMEGGVEKYDAFKNYLKKFNITENNYLINARIKAGNAGYDENKIFMADDGVHKLVYDSAVGKIKFGRVGYKDYIIYRFIAYNEKDKRKRDLLEDEAETARYRFQKSHKAISRKHKLGNLSPNELALKVLW
jgi:DNA adenine methylase